jgi:hypothetical protein
VLEYTLGKFAMNDNVYAVAIVVDVAFGSRLSSVAQRMPLWIVDTLVNRAAAEEHWHANPGQSHTEGVTTFKFDERGTPEQWCSDVLSSVDLHHGQDSHDPPYGVVEVFGTHLTQELRAEFAGLGFTDFSERLDGFRASIPAAV